MHFSRWLAVLSFIAILFFVVNYSNAQSSNGSPEAMVAQMKTSLGLSDEQAAQVLPIIQDEMNALDPILDEIDPGNDPTQEELAKTKEVMANTRGRLSAVLTPEQVAKWEKGKE